MKKTKIIFSIFLFSTVFFVQAQVKFKKVYGGKDYDFAYSGIQTIDKGYAAVGATTSFGLSSSDIYLVKIDSFGVPQWSRTYGGINIDRGLSVKQTTDSGYVIAGYSIITGTNGYDINLIKADKNGILIWTKSYGGTNSDFANSVTQTTDGGFIIAGGTYSYGIGDEDFYLIKTDLNGDTLWTKTYGSIAQDEAKSVKQTTDGGYILIGNTKKNASAKKSDILCVKTNSIGDTLWTKIYSNNDNDFGNDIVQTNDGGYAIAGTTFNTSINVDQGYIIKIDANGIVQNSSEWGPSVPSETTANSIIQDSNGYLVFAGRTRYGGTLDIIVYQIETNGAWHNSSTFGTPIGDEDAFFIQETHDKGFFIGGITNGTGYGLNDMLLIKVDSLIAYSGTIFVGVNETINNYATLNLFPNPASTAVTIKIEGDDEQRNKEALIEIYSIYGNKIVNEIKNNESIYPNKFFETTINTNILASGVYLIKISSGNLTVCKKLIIQH